MKRTIKHWFSLFLLMVLAGVGSVSAQTLSIADFEIEAGATKKVTIDLDQAGKTLLAFQADIVLPDGLTVKGKPKAVTGTMTDEFGEETEPTVTFANGRVVVYSGDGYAFNEDATSIITLTLVADANFVSGVIKLTGITISQEGNVKIEVADAVTKVNGGGEEPPAPTTYDITITAPENGTLTVDKAKAEEGETITVTATAADGYELEAITVNGTAIVGNTFVMPAAAVTIAATFKKKEVAPAGTPKLYIDDFSIEAGATKKVTINLDQAGNTLLAFQADIVLPEGLTVSGKPKAVTGTMTDEFGDETEPTVTFANGRIVVYSGDGYAFNEDAKSIVTLTIAAAANFEKGNVTLSNITISADGNVKIELADAVTKVNGGGEEPPAPTTYDITITAPENGTVTVDKQKAEEGETITVTATPAEGYELEAITVNGTAIVGNTFVMPAAAVTIAATFKKVVPTTYDITITASENGTVTVDKQKAEEGETITVTATPADGYELEAITVNGTAIVGNTFVMPAAAVTIAATFKKKEIAPAGTPKIYIEDFSIEAGATKKVNIDLDQAGNTLLAFQADIVLPEGLSISGKPKAVTGTMTDEFGEETEPTVTFANGRVVVYSGDGYAFNEDAKSIVSLTIAAADNFVSGVIKLSNITISADGNVKIELADAVTKVNGGGEEPPAPTTYDITITTPENGTITVDKEKAAAGETITVSATPAEGYELEAITINGEAIEGNTFVMPAAAVTIAATFKKKEIAPAGTPKLYIEDFSIEAGATKKVNIDLDQAGNTLLAFQADIVLPEGLSISGKPKAVTGTMTDEFGDATEPTVTFANGRVVVYSGDGYAFNEDAKSIVALTIAAADNFVSGVIKLSNITISAEGNVKIELADAVTKVNGGGEVTPTVFAITVAEGIENGAIAVDKTEAAAGETITVEATPAEGYVLEAITVNGNAIEGNTFEMPAEAVTVGATFAKKPFVHDFDEQEYLLLNVGAGLYLGAGNNWGTQASLLKHAEYVRLIPQEGDNVYFLDTQVSNGGDSHFLGTNGYMDSGAAAFTFQQLENGNYTISAPDGQFIGYDGASTIVSVTLTEADANAQWSIVKLTDAKAALATATEAQPMDATFLINDPNFGRNNRNKGSWNMVANNQNLGGGDVKNFCAESWHSDFTLSQALTEVPNGLYTLTAQGFYRQDGENETNLPVFYANDAAVTFPEKTGTENSMTDASNSFTQGLYTIDPIYVKVEDGTLTIGAKLEGNGTLWCIWDNFELTYYGPNAEIPTFAVNVAADIENGTVSVDKTEAKRGELITVTATPNDVYELEAITVNGVAIKGNTFEMPAKDATVGATFALKQFTVKFVIGEEVISEQTLDFGAAITVPEAREKEGYTFSWGEVAETVPAQDVTYEGTYTINQYVVKFVIGEEVISEQTLDFGAAITTPEAPAKEGYTFNGWGEVAETVPAQDVTYEGSYTVNQYVVKFVIGEEVLSEQTLDFGAAITAPEAPEKEGYTFNWSEVPATVPAADIVVTGEYTVNTYVIRYYDEEGTLLFEDEVKYGAAITLRDYKPADPNRFTFIEWIGEKFETMPAHDLEYKASLEDGIRAIFADGAADVYSLNGTKVRSNASAKDLKNLPVGTYIIRGKKFIVK